MKYPSNSNWEPDFKNDGVLFFAQRVYEMLYNYTDHTFKCPVLNTHLLVYEYLSVNELVQKCTIHENHLKTIMNEFQSSFKNDIVIQEHISEEKQKKLLNELNSSTPVEQKKIMEYILFILHDYPKWCKDYIKNIVIQEREKKKIEKALRCYIPELIFFGYSHEFIFHFTNEVFFNSSVESLDSFYSYIERFDYNYREYIVYIAIDKQAIAFEKILKERLNVTFISNDTQEDLKYDKSKYLLISMVVKAYDEQSAARNAYKSLDLFFRYYRFLNNQKNTWYNNKAKVVYKENDSFAFVNLKNYGLIYNGDSDMIKMGYLSETMISALLSSSAYSYNQINRAVVAHNNAIDDKNIRNRFLNLWSILEILFVSENEDAKINAIESKIVPVLSKDYLYIMFESIKEDIYDNIDNDRLSPIIDHLNGDKHWLQKIIAIKKYEDQKEKLIDLLSDYPIIRSRICQLSEKCAQKKNLLSDINRFEERVKWHLRRLYRTRNTIIHSGMNPKNLSELVEHLHNYVDEVLLEILLLLTDKPELKSVDNVILDTIFELERIKSSLKTDEGFKETEIEELFINWVVERVIP